MKELCQKAFSLFTVCLILVLLYTVATLIYALYCENPAEIRKFLPEMLHSSAISMLLALGGAFLLDIELSRR